MILVTDRIVYRGRIAILSLLCSSNRVVLVLVSRAAVSHKRKMTLPLLHFLIPCYHQLTLAIGYILPLPFGDNIPGYTYTGTGNMTSSPLWYRSDLFIQHHLYALLQ